jgi:hypothetical protein
MVRIWILLKISFVAVFTESLTKFGSTAQAQQLLLTITQKISATDKAEEGNGL